MATSRFENQAAEQRLKEFLRSGGELPIGPCSAWPRARNKQAQDIVRDGVSQGPHARKVRASLGKQVRNLAKTASQAAVGGKVTSEVREERMSTCRGCPSLIQDSERCSECGCFMAAKTWINADPNKLCPLQKWSR